MADEVIFLDIDGTLIKHNGSLDAQIKQSMEMLPGVKEQLLRWEKANAKIILTTGRRESLRQHTEQQLLNAGIYYDTLLMGLGRGTRILINDQKPNSLEPTAKAVNLKRNEGLLDYDKNSE